MDTSLKTRLHVNITGRLFITLRKFALQKKYFCAIFHYKYLKNLKSRCIYLRRKTSKLSEFMLKIRKMYLSMG